MHVDAAMLVYDKPTGLLSVPGLGPDKADCLLSRVQRLHPEARVVHRLDRDTSGLILFARSPAAQRALSRQFERRAVGKRYRALVAGRPEEAVGVIDLPLRKDMQRKYRHRVDHAHGKPARTRWRLLGEQGSATRLELIPETGRSHQLRVHCAAMGWPILGDPLYGSPDAPPADRLMLHAAELRLNHPDTGRPLHLRSDPPF